MSDEFRSIIRTNKNDYVLLILRMALVVLLLPHSLKELSSFSIFNHEEVLLIFLGFNILIMIIELLSILLIATGFVTRVSSAICLAVLPYHLAGEDLPIFEHLPFGIGFLWIGDYRMYLILITLNTILVIRGGGMYSLDSLLSRKLVGKKRFI